ncbi:MAG TPA: SIMPL domain-containing protein [Lachnospiraceae bacterium]|nr:SIMPL domain-containing protein [Lachnospiraceae bacterium]
MKEYKGIIIACIAGICAIICVTIMTGNLVSYKKTSGGGGITATGSASCDFESDLIVWRGSFTAYGTTTQEAYKIIKRDAEVIRKYLLDNGVTEDEMIFGSVRISQRWESEYNEEGYEIGVYLVGYDLAQEIQVTSNDVDKVDAISRDITQLIESDVEFTSDAPEYYYTKLDELKLQLIEEATVNAKERIDIMAAGTGGETGKLLNANLGVFQITAQNTNSDYSYGGAFDTSSRNKTASITVRLNYSVE